MILFIQRCPSGRHQTEESNTYTYACDWVGTYIHVHVNKLMFVKRDI